MIRRYGVMSALIVLSLGIVDSVSCCFAQGTGRSDEKRGPSRKRALHRFPGPRPGGASQEKNSLPVVDHSDDYQMPTALNDIWSAGHCAGARASRVHKVSPWSFLHMLSMAVSQITQEIFLDDFSYDDSNLDKRLEDLSRKDGSFRLVGSLDSFPCWPGRVLAREAKVTAQRVFRLLRERNARDGRNQTRQAQEDLLVYISWRAVVHHVVKDFLTADNKGRVQLNYDQNDKSKKRCHKVLSDKLNLILADISGAGGAEKRRGLEYVYLVAMGALYPQTHKWLISLDKHVPLMMDYNNRAAVAILPSKL